MKSGSASREQALLFFQIYDMYVLVDHTYVNSVSIIYIKKGYLFYRFCFCVQEIQACRTDSFLNKSQQNNCRCIKFLKKKTFSPRALKMNVLSKAGQT